MRSKLPALAATIVIGCVIAGVVKGEVLREAISVPGKSAETLEGIDDLQRLTRETTSSPGLTGSQNTIRSHAPNLADVAARAGVSSATVSRAFAKPDVVSAATRQAVMDAARDLGFVLNETGRILKAQRTKTIVAIVRDIGHPFGAEVLRSAHSQALARGYSLHLATIDQPLHQVREFLGARKADGVIILQGNLITAADFASLSGASGNVAFAGVSETGQDLPYPHLLLDNERASQDLAQYVVGLGHSRIAVLCHNLFSPVTATRVKGIRNVLGTEVGGASQLEVHSCDNTAAAAKAMASAVLDGRSRPTAVICTSDVLAVGLIAGLKEAGVRVPDDIGVTGFDDLTLVDCFDPPLTTVRQPRDAIGSGLINLICDLLENKPFSRRTQLPLILVKRRSIAQR